MSTTQIFVLSLLGVAVVIVAGVMTITARRGKPAAETVGRVSRRTVRRDRERRDDKAAVLQATALADVATVDEHEAPPVPEADPLMERETISQTEFDVTRRQFMNRSLLGIFGIFLAQFTIASLAFLWPKLKGGFGTPVSVGNVDEILLEVNNADGSVTPKFVASAQSWIVPFQADLEDTVFAGMPVVAGGLSALWQRCVHLGCRVPSCESSQGFECPCHGSKYNFHGEYVDGPAPRNMDRFVVTVNDTGDLIVDTGQVIQTARARDKSIAYPQGPTCN